MLCLVFTSSHQPTGNCVTLFASVLELFELYSDCATYGTVWGLSPGRRKRFFSSQNRPACLQGPTSLLNGCQSSFLIDEAAAA
jgi:hypothetical protein